MWGNLADLVRDAAGRRPDGRALVAGARSLTWAEVDRVADAAGRGLRRRGLEPGDRVALLLPNGPELVVAYVGALRYGLVAVPVSTLLTPAEVAGVLADAGASAAVAGPGAGAGLAAAQATATGLRLVVHVDTPGDAAPDAAAADEVATVGWEDLLAEGTAAEVPAAGAGEDLAALLYTSGTSGRPRAAMLSHRALLANLEQCAAVDPPPVRPDDVVLLALPIAHVYGLNAVLGMVLRAAATAVLVDRFDPVQTLETVRREQVTVVPAAPPMWRAWARLPGAGEVLGGLRLGVSGSAPLSPEAWQEVRSATGVELVEGYGLTEAAPVVTTALLSPRPKPGSVGRPLPGVELRLLDSAGGEVREGDPGEIAVRGDNVFSGYWPEGDGGPDVDGWYRTGDLAVVDPDGDLVIVGRVKELVVVSGFNVYPREVEDVLLTHPDVAEAAVVPVAHPLTGEAVKAYVVPRAGRTPDPDVLVAHCARRLARFKCPTVVDVVAELPHSGAGKVAKGRLPEVAARGLPSVPGAGAGSGLPSGPGAGAGS